MNILFPALTFDLYLISIHFRFPSYPFVSMQIVVLSNSVPCNELAIASLQSRWSRKTRKHRKHQWNQITRRMHWCSLFPVIALPLSSLHYLSYWQEFFLHVFSHINRIYSAPIPAAIAPLKCLPHASKRIFHESSRSVAFNMFPHFIVVVRCNMRGMVEDPMSLRFLSADCWCNLRVNVESSLRDRIRKIEREREIL